MVASLALAGPRRSLRIHCFFVGAEVRKGHRVASMIQHSNTVVQRVRSFEPSTGNDCSPVRNSTFERGPAKGRFRTHAGRSGRETAAKRPVAGGGTAISTARQQIVEEPDSHDPPQRPGAKPPCVGRKVSGFDSFRRRGATIPLRSRLFCRSLHRQPSLAPGGSPSEAARKLQMLRGLSQPPFNATDFRNSARLYA